MNRYSETSEVAGPTAVYCAWKSGDITKSEYAEMIAGFDRFQLHAISLLLQDEFLSRLMRDLVDPLWSRAARC